MAATATPGASQLGSLNCNNDFLIIPGGFNIGNPTPVANMAFDRYCGERLNAIPGSTLSTTVCSKFYSVLFLNVFFNNFILPFHNRYGKAV